jgi:hypothetical protein
MISDVEKLRTCQEALSLFSASSSTKAYFEIYPPSLKRSVSGASTLNGCTPVNLISRGSRGTWRSGVSLSKLRISLRGLDNGGNGIFGNAIVDISSCLSLDAFSRVIAGFISCVKMLDFRECTFRGVPKVRDWVRVAILRIIVVVVQLPLLSCPRIYTTHCNSPSHTRFHIPHQPCSAQTSRGPWGGVCCKLGQQIP